MSALLRMVTARWFLTLLGVGVFALLIWFAGPLVGFAGREPLAPVVVRLSLIAILFTIWLVVQIVRVLRARKRNRQLVDDLAAEASPPDPAQLASEEERAALRQGFSEAMALLRGSEGRRRLGGQWVYELPWYVIIGPPGCGKTTALVNSGLRFPLKEQLGRVRVSGTAGTRNCDWLFTDEAVLIDTAGRYTTQDSDAPVDKAAWESFLELLKQHRSRRPLNGVLVAFSLQDLMELAAEERQEHVDAVHSRVHELYARFNLRLPIYVLFTKADLVAGFTEFFEDLGDEGRRQVWGVSFPYPEAPSGVAPLEMLSDARAQLIERLDQRLFTRIQDERNPEKRRLVFGFLRQFGALGGVIDAFLNDAFAADRYRQRPFLRGVYFISGTQQGTPIDRVLGAIASDFRVSGGGPASFVGTPKSFFVTRLLREVVFPEAPLAGLDPRLERRRKWLRRGVYTATGVLALLALLALTTSFSRNHRFVHDVDARVAQIEEQIDALASEDTDPLGLLPLLNELRSLPGGYDDRGQGTPWGMGLGLYQGEKLGSPANRAYLGILRETLLSRVILRMEEHIRQISTKPEFLHQALRVYLMLDDCRSSADATVESNQGCVSHFQPEEVQGWVIADWRRNLPRETTEAEHAALASHLTALLATQPRLPLALDGQLIEDARDILRGPLDERLYRQLKAEGVDLDLPDFTIATAGGRLAPVVLTRPSGDPLTQGVPALYTHAAYHQGFDASVDRLLEEAAVDAWVLGPEAVIEPGTEEASLLKEQVRERYLDDYIDEWDALLEDIGIVPAKNLAHAAEIARILADGNGSPLRRVLLAAAAETELDRAPPEESAATAEDAGKKALGVFQKLEGRVGTMRRRADYYFGDMVGADASDGAAVEPVDPAIRVSLHFAWLSDLVAASEGGSAPLDLAQQQLTLFGAHVAAVDQAVKSGRPVLAAGDRAEIDAVKQTAATLPPAVAQMVNELADASARLIAGGVRAELNQEWGEVLTFCREVAGNRYPFKHSEQDTTLADFGALFGPGGRLDTFFSEHLSTVVDTRSRPWRWADASLGIPDAVLRQFERAAQIREAYFQDDGKTPSVSFFVRPVSMSNEATQFMLDVGGQVVNYKHDPPRETLLRWPSSKGMGSARQSFTAVGGMSKGTTEDGPWGFFRLLSRADVRPTSQPERFDVTFREGGLWAHLALRAASVRHPFDPSELRRFECPASL